MGFSFWLVGFGFYLAAAFQKHQENNQEFISGLDSQGLENERFQEC